MTDPDLWAREKELWAAGHRQVAGIDEAGRGPLAGPVVAAAVILSRTFRHDGIRDSKLLSPARREELSVVITEAAVCTSVASASEREIEEHNILQATLIAMRRAVSLLGTRPGCLLVDHLRIPDLDIPQEPIVGGDRLSASIAAASILAKVARDRLMDEYHERYSCYGFARNRGYGTAEHRRAIREHGPSPVHRRTFRGVREYIVPSPPAED